MVRFRLGRVFALLAAGCLLTGPLLGADDPPQKKEKPKIYDESADARADIAAAVAVAKKDHQRVLVMWGGNWCGWCHLLDGVLESDRTLSRTMLYEYKLVHVDIGKFDKNMDLAAELGADPKKHGAPFLTVIDGDGKAIANQETSSLEEGDHHDPAKVKAFLETHQATAPGADSLLSTALASAKKDGKRVFVHFSAPW